MSKEKLNSFVDRMIAEDPARVVGVVEKGTKFAFEVIKDAGELRLDYDVTILSPKKYFMPAVETLMKYDLTDGVAMHGVNEVEPTIIVGVHPYDVAAIARMDKIFADTNCDDNYVKKREAAVIIGVNIVNASPHAFPQSVGVATVDEGYDLMLTDLGDQYAIEVGTPRGEELLGKYGEAEDADVDAQVVETKAAVAGKFEKKFDFTPEEGQAMVGKSQGMDEFWESHSEKCLSCGSCVTTCPTCYCFDVIDEPDISLKKGEKYRTWDGCTLVDFTRVAGGEIFRNTKAERFKHRTLRKALYIPKKYGFPGCVGCGRCASACLPDIIDPVKVMNDLKGAVQ